MNARNFALAMAIAILTSPIVIFASEESPGRIEAIYFDNSKVAKLFLYPGRTALLDFPCDITRVAGGPAGDVEWLIGATNKSELDVWLTSGASQPTNLTVRCNHEVFVFDVIPNRTTHQEYVEIVGNYGGAPLKGAKLVTSSKADEYADKKLISASRGVGIGSPKKISTHVSLEGPSKEARQ